MTGPLPAYDRLILLGHLGRMLEAGINMARALQALSEQATSERARDVMRLLLRHIDSGRALSAAMAASRAFSPLEVGVVRAGELGGSLPEALRRLLSHQERDLGIARQIHASLLYPTVVMGCAFGLVIFLGQYLVAGLAPVLHQARVPLPLITRVVVGAVEMMHRPLPLFFLVVLSALAGWRILVWARSPSGKTLIGRAFLRMPLVGPVMLSVETQRVCEGLGILYGCGIPMVTALNQVADMCTFEQTREAVKTVASDLQQGVRLSLALKSTGFFPAVVIHMVGAGEEAGQLTHLLEKVSEYQEMQIRASLERFAAAIEPVSIVAMGILVAGIILVVFAPLYQVIATLD